MLDVVGREQHRGRMPLGAGCPRCSAPVSDDTGAWRCRDHGDVSPLWRAEVADYGAFAEHVGRSDGVPTLLPWPFWPGWMVTDFGCVSGPEGVGRASFVTCTGPTDLDGVVELSLVSEEPGVGLGGRCASLGRTDPGPDVGDGPPVAHVRVEGHDVPLWSLSTSAADVAFDRAVFAGEAGGRWLWLVLRPASAALLLGDGWSLLDVAELGPELVELPFGDAPPAW